MHRTPQILRRVALVVLGIPAVLFMITLIAGTYLYLTADFKVPQVELHLEDYQLSADNDSLRICGRNSLLLNKYGLWEAHILGSPEERGAILGIMSGDLLKSQESIFVEQIRSVIPSEVYIRFLLKVIAIFNRDMAAHIPEEYRKEIFAISASCSHDFDIYGDPYSRQLNYHAAHDIGHTMQEYMLVGCSSFAAWDNASADETLVIGRNFDFYFGDKFAENKIVLFVEPDNGYRYASIAWPGMMGVVSGMNEKGLTITINAAKGTIPMSSAMPVSMLARHILQYACNIEEAYRIAQMHEMFISESLLIGSAIDGCAAVIEKTPDHTAMFHPEDNMLICTNHFQSDDLKMDKHNIENIVTSDSPYRYNRIKELLDASWPIDHHKSVAILRDRMGLANKDIGLTNEKSINQCIAHHSVVFKPSELKMWVSTSPWQSGEFVCYDLSSVFDSPTAAERSFVMESETISPDTVFMSKDYKRVQTHRCMAAKIRQAERTRERLSDDFIDAFISNNPEYYEVYDISGNYMQSIGESACANRLWKTALSKEIPRQSVRDNIEHKLKKYDKERRSSL